METNPSLFEHLERDIPQGTKVRVYHVSTPPVTVPALFAAPPGKDEDKTFCEHHFLSISSPEQDDKAEVFAFAIEVLIFTTRSLTTVFIAKADSSGFSVRSNGPRGGPSVIAVTTATFLKYLLKPRLLETKVILSLFARSQAQYLFPGSSENTSKHILDDRHLIRWWCRILDTVSKGEKASVESSIHGSSASAYLVVPGCDTTEMKSFFPPSDLPKSASARLWTNKYPVEKICPDQSLPLRCLIPRLPDDPKARFLVDLDGEHIDEHGHWRSIKSLDQFWEMMSYRQECAAGRLVGFSWVIFPEIQHQARAGTELEFQRSASPSHQSNQGPNLETSSPKKLPVEAKGGNLNTLDDNRDKNIQFSVLPKESTLPTTPPHNVTPDTVSGKDEKVAAACHSADISYYDEAKEFKVRWPHQTRGQHVTTSSDLQSLMDQLLESDFAGEKLAAQSTHDYIQLLSKLTNLEHVGVEVIGKNEAIYTKQPAISQQQPINMLTGIRKKRKTENGIVAETIPSSNGLQTEPANLPASSIRKRPKP